MNSQMYTLEPLFDFQCLCDIDFGLYRLIKEDYYDRDIFDNDLFDSEDIRFIKTRLLTRVKFNPLFIFCKPGKLTPDNMDSLYKQFLDEEYDRILELSDPTNLLTVASASNSLNKIVNVTVLCKNAQEVNWINRYNYKLKCKIAKYENFNLTDYDTIYLKDIYTLTQFNQESINKKNIVIPRFMFNLETEYSKMEMPIIEVSKKYYKTNTFMLSDPYKDISAPIKEME